MVFKLTKPKLSVTLLSDTLFLHPPQPGETGQDELLRGIVDLQLSSARTLDKIHIELKGIGSLTSQSNQTHVQFPTLVKTLSIDVSNQLLKQGKHSWSFNLSVPASTAIQERCAYGSIRHLVRAWITEQTSFLGSLSSTIESDPIPVFLISSPCDRGEVPSGLELDVRQPSQELGQVNLRVSTPHLTVASLAFLSITLDSPPPAHVLSVSAYIVQSFKIDYPDKRINQLKPPKQRRLLFYADQTMKVPTTAEELLEWQHLGPGASLPNSFESRHRKPKPLAILEKGQTWSFSRIVRILDDDRLRPSTLKHVETPLQVSHQLVVELVYRLNDQTKTLEFKKSIEIASCCCLKESLLLPCYEFEKPKSKPRAFHQRCLCAQPLQALVNKEGASLAGADSRSNSNETQTLPNKLIHNSISNNMNSTSSTSSNHVSLN
ncbi:hypothetical protein OIO90_002485 [Microbotryomycetes sp. JL221]|nr:hypothetical protein OIO90_002485 [Microbotryomycetes sp. JL221]